MTLMGCKFGTPYLMAAFEAMDTDNNGSISFKELQSHLRSTTAVQQVIDLFLETARKAELSSLFEEWDTDRDGYISRAEFCAGCERAGYAFPDTVLDDLFGMFDFDRSGMITKIELTRAVRWVHSSRAAMALRSNALHVDEDIDVQQQLRDALMVNAVRVIDLFREWDEDGNGAVDKFEFRRALPPRSHGRWTPSSTRSTPTARARLASRSSTSCCGAT